MEPITIDEICRAVKGELAWGDPAGTVTGVYTDSRDVGEGDLFVPIIGERVNAHKFIPDVLKQGAACVFASERDYIGETGAGIFVEDTLKALQQLAAWYRRRFSIPVIGVTGSVGKTSTKEMIGAVLEKKYTTLITYKNMNSQVGLPLMMFHLDSSIEMAVFEMGISIPGEMNRLVDIASPEAAVMTNIGVSHIGNLGSRENICAEKGHIIRDFGEDGKLFACGNGDLYDMVRNNLPVDCCKGHCDTFFYGIKSEFTGDAGELPYYADNIRAGEDGEVFTFHYPGGEIEVSLSVRGEHNVTNAMAALAVGLNYGVPIGDAATAVGAYKPISMRGEIHEVNGVHLIDDTYNASPDSIRSNLHALFSYPGKGRRLAVLGDVLELGERSQELHRSIGEYIASEAEKGRRLDALYAVGGESEEIVRYLKEHTDIPAVICADNAELTEAVRKVWQPEDWILFKGSRGMHLDEVVKALLGEQS